MPSGNYTYDANGNTLSDPSGKSYTWDFENRMVQAVVPSTGTVTFEYDPFGRRIEKTTSSTMSIYAYDKGNLIEETNASGGVVARYTQIQEIDEPLAILRSATTSYCEADSLGSITSLSNAAGALVQTYTFDSFGKQTASFGSLVNTLQYTGRDSDSETGLYFYRARYYNPSVGRFLSEDTIGFDGGINFYSYVGNNPANFTDPFGFASCYYQIAAHKLVCMSSAPQPVIGPPYGVQVGPDGVASGGSMKGPTSCTNNNKCVNNRFEGPVVPGYYKINYDTRPEHQGMNVYRLQSWPHHWDDGLLYDPHLSRGGFELHLGTVSLGCINVDKNNPNAAQQYRQLNQLLQSEDGLNYLTVAP